MLDLDGSMENCLKLSEEGSGCIFPGTSNLGDTDLREIMDSVGNYDCSLEKAIEMWVIE